MGRGNGFACVLLVALCAAGCAGGGGNNGGGGSSKITAVTTSCSPSSITTNQTSTCTAAVTGTGSYSSTVSWTATGGTVTGGGMFTPSGAGSATVTATSSQDTTKSGSANITVAQGPTITAITVTPSPTSITTDQYATCTAAVTGTGDFTNGVTWSATGGTITSDGVFTPSGAGTGTCTANSTETGFTTVSGSANISISVVPPNITGISPAFVVCDTFCNDVSYQVSCAGCENGDLFHDATGIFTPDLALSLSSGQTSFNVSLTWQQGMFAPWMNTWEIAHPGGGYGASWNTAFFGSGSQSTLAVSPVTGTLFEVDQQSGQVYTEATGGTTGTLLAGPVQATSPTQVAVDDVSGNIVYVTMSSTPQIAVYDESGNTQCSLAPGMAGISAVAAKGGYIVVTDPTENKVGIAKMDCSGYQAIAVAGQPWAVAMTNGTELDAYVLSRDQWSTNGLPGLSKIGIPSGTIEGSVELSGLTPVSTVRSTNQYGALYQVQAFTNSPTAAVLSMSDATVVLVSTDTSGSNTMQVSQTTSINGVPFAIAAQEMGSSSTLWVAYMLNSGPSGGTQIGAIQPGTPGFTSNIAACPSTALVAGGFIATSNGVYCAQGQTIEPPLSITP